MDVVLSVPRRVPLFSWYRLILGENEPSDYIGAFPKVLRNQRNADASFKKWGSWWDPSLLDPSFQIFSDVSTTLMLARFRVV